MDTVILEVADAKTSQERFIRAWETGLAEKEARISFETPELMWKVLTEKRWAILKAMCGAGAVGLRELSRKIRRDVKAVHTDTRALLNAGVIDRTEDGKLLFPYRRVEIRFALEAEKDTATECIAA